MEWCKQSSANRRKNTIIFSDVACDASRLLLHPRDRSTGMKYSRGKRGEQQALVCHTRPTPNEKLHQVIEESGVIHLNRQLKWYENQIVTCVE